ncbi:MAG TPA: hypothetical protein PKZ91_09340 [Saprospiraceae bacterium]|nr:hypothetical protein [Saprospiraceae bacterium]
MHRKVIQLYLPNLKRKAPNNFEAFSYLALKERFPQGLVERPTL